MFGRAAGALACAVLAACGSGRPAPSSRPAPTRPPATTAVIPSSSTTTTTTTSTTAARTCTDLGRWTTGQLARQLVVVPVLDFGLPDLGRVISSGVGGVLFLGGAPAPRNLPVLVAQADAASAGGIPLLVMADEEGGGVQRLQPLVGPVPWPRQMAASMTPAQVASLAARVGGEMRAAGVNMDLAPVLDVDGGPGPNAHNPDGQRAFSGMPATASAYGVAFIDGLRRSAVIPVAKHFPGLGGSTGNTDVGPASTQPLASLRSGGMVPFRAAIADGVPAVMVANAAVPGLTTRPASLSTAVIAGLLRGELGFRGLVLTDSLSAGAIRAAGYGVADGAAAAVEAGADLVLFGSTLTPTDVSLLKPSSVAATTDAVTAALVAAVRDGALPAATLVEAARQVLAAKGVSVCP